MPFPMTSPPIHLVGSIPLRDAKEVFATVSEILGGRVSRIPRGILSSSSLGRRSTRMLCRMRQPRPSTGITLLPSYGRAPA
jgi:hypothetical protein